jgi:hypothetical protein
LGWHVPEALRWAWRGIASRDASKIRAWRTSIWVEARKTLPCLPQFRPDGLRRSASIDRLRRCSIRGASPRAWRPRRYRLLVAIAVRRGQAPSKRGSLRVCLVTAFRSVLAHGPGLLAEMRRKDPPWRASIRVEARKTLPCLSHFRPDGSRPIPSNRPINAKVAFPSIQVFKAK